jgi:hypothetical protein
MNENCPYKTCSEKCPWVGVTKKVDDIQAAAIADPEDTFCAATAQAVLDTSKSMSFVTLDVVKSLLKELLTEGEIHE